MSGKGGSEEEAGLRVTKIFVLVVRVPTTMKAAAGQLRKMTSFHINLIQ
jgi:hypothetical protein